MTRVNNSLKLALLTLKVVRIHRKSVLKYEIRVVHVEAGTINHFQAIYIQYVQEVLSILTRTSNIHADTRPNKAL